MFEEWKNIENYDDYQISNFGKIKSFKQFSTGKILSQRINRGGYCYINLCKNGKYKSIQIHSLVAKAFVPGRTYNKIVNHIDGLKTNNIFSNLEWLTKKENSQHAFRTGLAVAKKGSQCYLAKLKEKDINLIKRLRKRGWTHKKIANLFKVNRSTITQILAGTIWKHLHKS